MIEVGHQGQIAVVTMTHGKANAMDTELADALWSSFGELRDASVKAVVLTGQGNIFSAGVDLLRAHNSGPEYLRAFLPALRRMLETIFFFPKPLVAAVNGHAIAGGCVLACAADRRLMAGNCGRIGVTELLVGVPFPVIALEVMRHATVPHRFEEVVYSGATFAPGDGKALGFIHEVIEPPALLDCAVEAAETLAKVPAQTFALTKRQTRQPVADRVAKDGPLFDPPIDMIWRSPETSATIRDYANRTFKKI